MTTTAPAGALWFTLAAIVRQLVRVGALKNGLAQVVKAFDRAVTRIVVAISFLAEAQPCIEMLLCGWKWDEEAGGAGGRVFV